MSYLLFPMAMLLLGVALGVILTVLIGFAVQRIDENASPDQWPGTH